MIDEFQTKQFWSKQNSNSESNKQNNNVVIKKVYYSNNDTTLLVEGKINFNTSTIEDVKSLIKIDFSKPKPTWYLCIDDSNEQPITDETFKNSVLEGIEIYVSSKKNILDRIKKLK